MATEVVNRRRAMAWLSQEVDVNLGHAQDALQQFAANSADTGVLVDALAAIHQIRGSMAIANAPALVVVIHEAELLLRALQSGKVGSSQEACETLAQGLSRVSAYFHRLILSGDEMPSSLYALLNDMRALRGAEFYTLDLDLGIAPPVVEDVAAREIPKNNKVVLSLIKGLRKTFQAALLAMLKEGNQGQHVKKMEKTCARLRELYRGAPRENLWWVAGAFIEGIYCHSIPLTPATRRLFKDMDSALKLLQGEASPTRLQPLEQQLMANLLYYVATSGGTTERIQSVAAAFGFVDGISSFLNSAEFGARVYEVPVLQSVSVALLEEIDQIKARIVEYQGNPENPEPLSVALLTAQRIASSLQMVAREDLQPRASGLVAALTAASRQGALDSGQLAQLAAMIVEVESALSAWAAEFIADRADPALPKEQRIEVNRAWGAVIAEIRRSVAQIRDVLVDFFDVGDNRDGVAELPADLHQLYGALSLLGLKDVAEKLLYCRDLIRDQVLCATPREEEKTFTALADALTAVEQYLDDFAFDFGSQQGAKLPLADSATNPLGCADPLDQQPLPEQQEPLTEVEIMSPTKDKKPVNNNSGSVNNRAKPSPAAEIDPEIREIFVEEGREVLATLDSVYPQWQENPANKEALVETRRAFHTLKGSGRMVGAEAIGELAWSVENMLNRVMDGRIEADANVVAVIASAMELVPAMISAFESGTDAFDVEREAVLRDLADRLANGEAVIQSPQPAATPEQTASPQQPGIITAGSSAEETDTALVDIFIVEARSHLQTLADFVSGQKSKAPFYDVPSNQLQAALHTLKGSAHMASIMAIAALVTPLERFIKELVNFQVVMDEDSIELLDDCADYSVAVIAALDAGREPDTQDLKQIQARIAELRERMVGAILVHEELAAVDPAFLNLLMADGMAMVLDAEDTVAAWQAAGHLALDQVATMAAELRELEGGAAKAGFAAMAGFSAHLAQVYEGFNGAGNLSASGYEVLQQAHACLLNMADAVAAHQDIEPATEQLLAQLSALRLDDETAPPVADVTEAPPASGGELAAGAVAPILPEDMDAEVVELFLDEADELLESLEQGLHQWTENPAQLGIADGIKRDLHTFKGGARMAGLVTLGDLSHDFESVVIDQEPRVNKGDDSAIADIMGHYDRLAASLDACKTAYRNLGRRADTAASRDDGADSAVATRQPAVQSAPAEAWKTAEILPFTGAYKGLYPLAEGAAIDFQQSAEEQVRIAAAVLDSLVNLAGESSISRSQVEQNINEFIFSLDEMEATIRRMQDQVRRMAIETDAQVMFRREQIEASESIEGFDPLEMDRYSQLQQLSRSLLESASDLQDLRDTLVDKSRDAESLLLQQSRINTDLQEGLMRTRMVPFTRVVPRLRRLVRQVSSTLGKQVNLQLGNVEGELDRSVLERVMSPLEHMIRNAIDHGIEVAEKRSELGKAAEGTIAISFSREGGDVLIRMADDGRGLDIDAIRDKAFSLGLLNEHIAYSDNDIAQFIFHPGFSTSATITQTSGRGVGMDVVNSEVRQLGGSVTMTTQKGAGTEFQVRLPFTVSVNRALMIELGEDSYALALNSIAGVTRMSADRLMHYYQNPADKFEYGGQLYDVRYMGALLSPDLRPTLDTAIGQLPIVLIRVDDNNYAVQVDALIGSREIVVKTLGAHFSRVPGLSGATVLGDGRVVVILDLQGLLRDQAGARVLTPMVIKAETRQEAVDSNVQTIMVVDDSVTVRKVTSRFLEREGFRVITAKDGVDAMRALQDITPDMMLLDIEMPRMDGFEVARLVRSTQRLKDLPIIMITSRTGDKHRERALAMGVNRYLGKPYQEDVLIREVYGLLTSAETG